jgi:D-glycero-D-manno-heptose 1,7-bisphosphate phosphatase
MNKAVFFDRDGVINVEHGFTYRMEDFMILPDVFEMMKHWQDKGYLLIVVSNQSGVAKKLYQQSDIEMLHDHLRQEFIKNGIKVEEIYYCIHHPDVSRCICRKPDSLFVEKALARFDIDPNLSFFIGDKPRDVEAAQKAGVKGILITANSPLKNLVNLIE